ncbi:MAG: YhgE/Pip family protein, partial [Eggerthellaceae bacterium]|nr:YhgE/Pip family protein [Eggerthellaceae bacterium]
AFSGSEALARGLLEGSQNMHVGATQEKASMLSSPVSLKETYYSSVKNYGTGFAPYFIGLALWVGALMGSFIFKPLNRRLILSGMSPIRAAFVSYMPLGLLALVQVFLLLIALQFGLKLQIDNVIAYYIFGVAVALTFAALIQMLMGVFGFPGKFIAIVLLMLQLTSAAGTFPIEQTPKFFQVISPFLPMTYVVSGMREIMTGLNIGVIIEAVGMLFIFAALSFIITISTARGKRMVSMDDLHPLIQF